MMWPAGGHTVPSHHFPDYITAVTKFLTRVNLQPSFSKRKSFTDRRTVYPQPFQGITVIWRENNLKGRRIWRKTNAPPSKDSRTLCGRSSTLHNRPVKELFFATIFIFFLSSSPSTFHRHPYSRSGLHLLKFSQGPKSGLSLTSCVAFISKPLSLCPPVFNWHHNTMQSEECLPK